ncbi:MAG: heparinase II/III family protein [Victivallaceae bacterium]|nr:heparinase II/III family protein [Victivallaceae bacterium]
MRLSGKFAAACAAAAAWCVFFSPDAAALTVAIEGFTCDFEWMERAEDYWFLRLDGIGHRIVPAGGKEHYLELESAKPTRRIELEVGLNLFYTADMAIGFRCRESGAGDHGRVVADVYTENGGHYRYDAGNSSADWRSVEIKLDKMTAVQGAAPEAGKTVLTKLTIGLEIPDSGLPERSLRLDLDDVQLYAGEQIPLRSEANPIFFNWRRGMGEVSLEYSQDKAFPANAAVRVVTSENFYTPDGFMTPGRWYYRVTAADGRRLPAVTVDLPETAHRFTTAAFHAGDMVKKPRPWLNRPQPALTDEQRAAMLKQFADDFAVKPHPNPPPFREGDPDYPSFISWYGGVHDRLIIAAGARLQRMAEIAAATGDESLYPRLLEYALLICAWDPDGGSSHLAGDIGAYHVQRGLDAAYDVLHDQFDAETLKPLRDNVKLRAMQVWVSLNPFTRNQRREYNNHAWLAVYGMAEAGVVLCGDDPDAERLVEYSRELFIGLFLAVQGGDGENGEGIGYWSYGGNFLKLYAQMMKESCGIDLFRHPWLGRTVMFPIYTCIPNAYAISFANTGKPNHGVRGPLKPDKSAGEYIAELAAFSNNPYGVWYAGKSSPFNGVEPKVPVDLPPSIFYPSIGWAVFNTSLADGFRNVSVAQRAAVFASGHQHDDQNNILINAYGDKLLINSGYYDYYGSRHFNEYSTQTQAHNTLLVNDRTQGTRRGGHGGKLTAFSDSKYFGYTVGEAGNPTVNAGKLTRWTRRTLFIKPDFVVVHDIVNANEPVKLSFLAHAAHPLYAYDPMGYFDIVGERAELYAKFIHPKLKLTTSTGYPVNPVRPRGNNEPLDEAVIAREWHLKADTAEKVTDCDIMTAMQIRALPADRVGRAEMSAVDCENGRAVQILTADGGRIVVMSGLTGGTMKCGDLESDAAMFAVRYDKDGREAARFDNRVQGESETFRDVPGIDFMGAKLAGQLRERADGPLYHYTGKLMVAEPCRFGNPFGRDVNVIIDMQRWKDGSEVLPGEHFVLITSPRPLNNEK